MTRVLNLAGTFAVQLSSLNSDVFCAMYQFEQGLADDQELSLKQHQTPACGSLPLPEAVISRFLLLPALMAIDPFRRLLGRSLLTTMSISIRTVINAMLLRR